MFSRTAVALWLSVIPGAAFAQVHVEVVAPAPSFRWEAPPPMVVVEPGVQVVEDYDQEVFYNDGYYWSRSGDQWYRTRDHNGGWVVVERQAVPVRLTTYTPGRYRHYRAERAERREEKIIRKQNKRNEKRRRKLQRSE